MRKAATQLNFMIPNVKTTVAESDKVGLSMPRFVLLTGEWTRAPMRGTMSPGSCNILARRLRYRY
jgi:hypothetical protein